MFYTCCGLYARSKQQGVSSRCLYTLFQRPGRARSVACAAQRQHTASAASRRPRRANALRPTSADTSPKHAAPHRWRSLRLRPGRRGGGQARRHQRRRRRQQPARAAHHSCPGALDCTHLKAGSTWQTTRPRTSPSGTGPYSRLSRDIMRLSPCSHTWPGGTWREGWRRGGDEGASGGEG